MNQSVPADRSAPASAAAETPAPRSDGDGVDLASLGKIREILFGAQNRSTEQRIVALEERVDLDRDRVTARLGELERLVNTTHEALGERIKAARTEAAALTSGVKADLKKVADQLEHTLVQLGERVDKGLRESRQQLVDQVVALREELRFFNEAATKAVAQQGARLEASKLDRLALGEILADLSTRVSR